jgi:uncharacterized protein (TIGR02001 family)
MRKLTQALVFAGVVAAPSMMTSTVALAEEAAAASPITANVTLASEYVYRGISQTREKPAIQGGFDYAHASGFYAGVWGSNISWLEDVDVNASSSVEIDLYGGYKGKINDDFSYDVGFLRYQYPGDFPGGFNSPNTNELYVAGTWKMLTLKYSYALSDLFGYVESDGSQYLDLTANFDLGAGFSLGAHVGRQDIKNNSLYEYTDWKLGVTKDFGAGLSATAAYIDTNGKADMYTIKGDNIADSRFVLSVAKTF